ncbi:hypothetical protein AGLY_013310 [Aphis glycines]|uniref:Uncharacterized protein n=1 Tax=Aphis glycines TaxID=307491 RepID=A0A6G0T790_APHGL|nr:hypothetical protein AGLY_013310 [Aphis glycines]
MLMAHKQIVNGNNRTYAYRECQLPDYFHYFRVDERSVSIEQECPTKYHSLKLNLDQRNKNSNHICIFFYSYQLICNSSNKKHFIMQYVGSLLYYYFLFKIDCIVFFTFLIITLLKFRKNHVKNEKNTGGCIKSCAATGTGFFLATTCLPNHDGNLFLLFLTSLIRKIKDIAIVYHKTTFYLLDSERSDKCIDFTMIITSRNNALISNFGSGFRWQSEYPCCIIKVKSEYFSAIFKIVEKNKEKFSTKSIFLYGFNSKTNHFKYLKPSVYILVLSITLTHSVSLRNLNFGVFRALKHKPPFSSTTGNYILG